jgi:DNA repair protein RecN (Recombination protein N)
MLKHLSIKNYALIQRLEMQPDKSLNVITGETGAGKSIMLGAIGLLLGNRADSKMLWDENEKCVTEAHFEISDNLLRDLFEVEELDYDQHIILRREVSGGGKSRAFVNDTPVTLDVIKKIGKRLLDIHSQHETLELGNKTFQLDLIDSFAGNGVIKASYETAWRNFKKAKLDFELLKSEADSLRQQSDFIHFQLEELSKANLREGELELLESELKIREHAEDIKIRFNQSLAQLSRDEFSVEAQLSSVRGQLNPIASFSPTYLKLTERFESIRLEIRDLIQELEAEEEQIEFEPSRLEHVKQRLSLIYLLLKKHQVNEVKELVEIFSSLTEKASKASNVDELLLNALQQYEAANQQVLRIAKELSVSRRKVVASLTKKIELLLSELGIENAKLEVETVDQPPDSTGVDSVEILFSANKGILPRSLAQVASGGEFSRLMFAVKFVMAEKTAMPTLILDEIDNGVSGEVAIQLGNMMRTMAKSHQVIAITHLPQIAAKADKHYFVFKDNSTTKTVSQVKELDAQGKVIEIAKMIGGATPSALALENAKELIHAK